MAATRKLQGEEKIRFQRVYITVSPYRHRRRRRRHQRRRRRRRRHRDRIARRRRCHHHCRFLRFASDSRCFASSLVRQTVAATRIQRERESLPFRRNGPARLDLRGRDRPVEANVPRSLTKIAIVS